MKRLLFFTPMFFAILTVSAQQPGVQPDDPAFIAKYANFNFKGKFASVIESDGINNYFLLDFSQLPTRFDRVYFMNVSFASKEIINIDPDLNKTRVCFMANVKYDQNEVLAIYDDIKKKVVETSFSLPADKKAEWLKNNDKYN
ncbi:MAG: hypothetical protein Q8M08_09590 [Bacteroidales bacterium]|nr:hypothetical protein [Bacteroidales bacterium]